jgi:hypothetical protein
MPVKKEHWPTTSEVLARRRERKELESQSKIAKEEQKCLVAPEGGRQYSFEAACGMTRRIERAASGPKGSTQTSTRV